MMYFLFILSILSSVAILFILSYLWFTDARNRQLKSMFALGLVVAWWLTANAICMVVRPEHMPFIYTFNLLSVCVFPFTALWFCLRFTGARLGQSRVFFYILMAVAALDGLALLTNPLHRQFYSAYGYPIGEFGPLFNLHSLLSYIALIGAFLSLLIHALRHVRKRPSLLFMVVLLLAPCAFNMLLNLGILPLGYDLTPLGFFVTFMLFAMVSYRTRLFSFRTMALASVFESIGDAVLILNREDIIIDSNQTFDAVFRGFIPVSGRTPLNMFLRHLRDSGAEIEDSLPEGEGGSEFTCLLDGREKTFQIKRHAIYSKNRLNGSIITLTDVSDYRAMIREINAQNQRLIHLKELAESASEAKGNFLANMSHEMRTPMNAILGMTDIARRALGETEENAPDVTKIEYCIGKIKEASSHLLGVINDVLDMSKIESGKLELTLETFDLRGMLRQATGVIGYSAQQKNQSLTVDLGEDLPPFIRSDEQRLAQVLANLLSNAVKFTPEGGTVSLSARLLDRQASADGGADICTLEFEVCDTGIGISAEQQSRLFHPFEQADNGISRRYGGTGLGLAISKNIVEAMDGRFSLRSEPGRGSVFTFTVKAAAAAEGGDRPAAEPREGAPEDFSACRLLLAEDIDINREILTALLEPTGIRIDCAENGNMAVRMFRENPDYDIVFMDIQMPDKDGYEATREIRAMDDAKARAVPIVAMTANVFREDIERCLDAGMNEHIGKPINLDDVLTILRKYLARRP